VATLVIYGALPKFMGSKRNVIGITARVATVRRGGELEQQAPPVTLPKFEFADLDIEKEAREAAARVAERKIVRAGLDAWRAIGKADSFENWKRIGAAILGPRKLAPAVVFLTMRGKKPVR
jgi:hypothetical protein